MQPRIPSGITGAHQGTKFLITSLPRCGSTSLAHILNTHPDIRCLIEPFHPRRYNGVYNQSAVRHRSVRPAVQSIWTRFNGIKHVWEASGWPFHQIPFLNCELTLGPGLNVLLLVRRNYFRRLISNLVCRQTNYWIGTKQEFELRVRTIEFKHLDPTRVRNAILRDVDAISRYTSFLKENNVKYSAIEYEELFSQKLTVAERYRMVVDLLTLMGFSPITVERFENTCSHNFDASAHRWTSEQVYRRIPNIEELECQVGSDKTGWIFKEI
jgi:hypothetical protein